MRWPVILAILLVGCTAPPVQPTPTPSVVKVIFPAEGDVLEKGQTYELRWSGGGEETVAAFLHDRSLESLGVSVSISERYYGVANTGSYTFTVPDTLKDGVYRLEIGDGTSGYFQIVTPGYTLYENPFFNVLFSYPSSWQPNTVDYPPIPDEGPPNRYEGEEGYFLVVALAGPASLDEAVAGEAEHILRPYGENPIIEKRFIAGAEGAIITPRDPNFLEAALIVPYPKPIMIEHSPGEFATYSYLIIYAHKDFVVHIADTLSFLQYE